MIIDEAKAGRQTKQVLQTISRHLSSREDCRDIEYSVTIHNDPITGHDIVEVSPYITVFPTTFQRKDTDRRSIAYHVMAYHFPELLQQSSTSVVYVIPGTLVHGTYIYKKYRLTSRRKWRKI